MTFEKVALVEVLDPLQIQRIVRRFVGRVLAHELRSSIRGDLPILPIGVRLNYIRSKCSGHRRG
jgi:hypothetical protein